MWSVFGVLYYTEKYMKNKNTDIQNLLCIYTYLLTMCITLIIFNDLMFFILMVSFLIGGILVIINT